MTEGRCKTCGDPLGAPVYTADDHWFCSLEHFKLWKKAADIPNYED